MPSPYQLDANPFMHRGAIYEFRPIFWLRPPLWIVRNLKISQPGRADVYEWHRVGDAFRLYEERHEEDVIARAKIRYVVILSNNSEAQQDRYKSVLVGPLYTVHITQLPSETLRQLRNNEYTNRFYLPADPNFPGTREWYVDFRNFQHLDKGFLTEGKIDFALTDVATKAILQSYKNYLSIV